MLYRAKPWHTDTKIYTNNAMPYWQETSMHQCYMILYCWATTERHDQHSQQLSDMKRTATLCYVLFVPSGLAQKCRCRTKRVTLCCIPASSPHEDLLCYASLSQPQFLVTHDADIIIVWTIQCKLSPALSQWGTSSWGNRIYWVA